MKVKFGENGRKKENELGKFFARSVQGVARPYWWFPE